MFADLERFERKVYSQNGEDGVIEAIFTILGVTNRFFVEFGCGSATECNTALLLEKGWRGLLMDSVGVSQNPRVKIQTEWITAENVNPIFEKHTYRPLSIFFR